MPYLLAPHEVSTNSARVWLAAADSPAPLEGSVLEYGNDSRRLDAAGWHRWMSGDGQHVLHHRTLTLHNLTPATTYPLAWRIRDREEADGAVMTLPDRLPALDETPFTVLLGSCFCSRRHESAVAGSAYFHLPHGRRPVLKFLCGDQVYLDDPATYFLRHTHRAQELERLFFENYVRTWGQRDETSGFNQILKSGANYFSPDDHELWNNAPNRATLVRDTWTAGGRGAWKKAATELYRIFQTDQLLTSFAVGQLSFLVVDTRMERAPGSTTFLPPAEMDRVGHWVRALTGPGVLVIGQPVLEARGGWFSQRVIDRTLPDYEQYGDLVRHLASSQHSIVILTGDVHYGRLARCFVRADLELIEVVSSPMALVDDKVGGRWHAAPSFFPATSVPGAPITRVLVRTDPDWNRADNHFVTLEFTGVGDSVRMEVYDWRIGPSPVGELVGRATLR
jgi:hypothetical protein